MIYSKTKQKLTAKSSFEIYLDKNLSSSSEHEVWTTLAVSENFDTRLPEIRKTGLVNLRLYGLTVEQITICMAGLIPGAHEV